VLAPLALDDNVVVVPVGEATVVVVLVGEVAVVAVLVGEVAVVAVPVEVAVEVLAAS
jgi:hypothetical protein